MQCNQPLFCSSFQNNQFPPYLTQPYYTDIIGEGDVTMYTFPDGSTQCYFVPVNRRDPWVPHFTSSYYMPSNVPNNKEIWFVRSILNTYPPSGLNQMFNNCRETFLKSNINSQCYGFVQKFHNDSCTSTSDLHYFFPSLCNNWAKGCAGIQVEIPKEKTIFHYGTICNRPCHCNHKIEIATTESNLGKPCTETPMCVDEVKSTHSCCEGTGKKGRKRKKNKDHSCCCHRVETSDKAVATCVDRAISCSDVDRTDIETEVWYPRRRAKRSRARCPHAAAASHSACSDPEQCDA